MQSKLILPRKLANKWLLIVLLVSPIFFVIPITHDAAWQMWLGRQMAHSANLYTDLVEVNPPLWFWMAVPLARLAELLDVRSIAVLICFFIAAIVLALCLSGRVLRRDAPIWPMMVAMLFPIQHFAQREHFILIFTIPYVLLIAKRERGHRIEKGDAIAIGFCASVAFALKPQFALVPIALEIWAWRVPKVRPETLVLAISCAAYITAIAFFESDFFTRALPLVMTAYGQFAPMQMPTLLRSFLPFLFASPILLRARNEAAAFTVGALAAYLTYLFQDKGWDYQELPALGLLFIAVILAANGPLVRKAIATGAAILILVPNMRLYRTPPEFRLNIPVGASYAALSVSPRAGWPLVEERRLKWTLPYMSLWMAPAVTPDVAHDLACNPPDFLLIDNRQVDFNAYVVPVLADYRLIKRGSVMLFQVVRRPARPSNCQTFY